MKNMENSDVKIKSDEVFIGIDSFTDNSEVKTNEINNRIHFLTENYLEKKFDTGEKILYKDPTDNRLWELIYPNGYMNGWGIPALRNISSKDAFEKYKVDLISPNETIIKNDEYRIYALTQNHLKMIFDAGWGNALYIDPSDERLWELICLLRDAKNKVTLKYISNKEAKTKYVIEKIQPNETVIDSDWTKLSNHLTTEEAFEVQKRIYWLRTNYLEKLVDKGWEILYVDHSDNRFWELTYPNSEMQGGGPPVLKNIDKGIVLSKYGKIKL
jgi:hypothetical protein